MKKTHRLLHHWVREYLLFKGLCGTKSGRWRWYVLPHFEILLPAHNRLSLTLSSLSLSGNHHAFGVLHSW